MYKVEVFRISSHFLGFFLPQVLHFSSADLLCSLYLLLYFVFSIWNIALLTYVSYKNPKQHNQQMSLSVVS